MQNQIATVSPNKGMAITSFAMGMTAILWYIIIYLLACVLSGETAVAVLSIMVIAGPFVQLILGILGIVFSSVAKKSGATGGLRTAGFVLSLLSLIFGALTIFICLIILLIAGMAYRDILNWAFSLL